MCCEPDDEEECVFCGSDEVVDYVASGVPVCWRCCEDSDSEISGRDSLHD